MTRGRGPASACVLVALCLVPAQSQNIGGQSGRERVETLERAARLIGSNQAGEAASLLMPLIRKVPGDAVALNLMGLALLAENRRGEAEETFRAALATGHRILGPHLNLARLYATEKPLDALGQLDEALRIDPANEPAQTLVREIAKHGAASMQKQGDLSRAQELLSHARSMLPRDPEILFDSGMLALETNSPADAKRWFQQGLQIRPDHYDTVYGLARADLALNDAQAAEQAMRRYLRGRPSDATAHFGLGYILMAEQKLDEAQRSFEQSLALEPNQTESIYQLGEIALAKEQDAEARRRFEQVLDRDPHHAGALTECGIMAYREAKYESARGLLEQAVASAPSYQKAHYYYALTLSKLGRKSEADREFALARQLQKQR